MYHLNISKPALLQRQKVSGGVSEVINKLAIQQIHPSLHEARSTVSKKISISLT